MPSKKKTNQELSIASIEMQPIDQKYQKELFDLYWKPYIAEMMTKDAELARSTDNPQLAAQARERIYNRVFGKPTEVMKQDSNMQININIRPITTIKELNGMIDDKVIEGEYKIKGLLNDTNNSQLVSNCDDKGNMNTITNSISICDDSSIDNDVVPNSISIRDVTNDIVPNNVIRDESINHSIPSSIKLSIQSSYDEVELI